MHSHELSIAGTCDAEGMTRRTNCYQPNSATNHPFFGSAVSLSVRQSAAAALIADTGIDAALASIQDLEIDMDSTLHRSTDPPLLYYI